LLMKCVVNIFIFLTMLLGLSGVVIAEPIRGVQIFNLTSRSIDELHDEFQFIRDSGFNTIFLRVFKNPHDSRYNVLPETKNAGVYFNSSTEPVVADLLTPAITIAHSLDMQIFAWITTRKSLWILDDNPDWDSPTIDLEHQTVDRGKHLDIFRTDVERRFIAMLTDITLSGVDGILIQDDLVSRQSEDFFTNAWRSFYGHPFELENLPQLFDFSRRPVRYRSLYHKWARYKSRLLAAVLRRMVTHVKSLRPSTSVAVNLYYEVVTAPHHGRQWLSQDLEELMMADIDYWTIMAYQQQMSRELDIPIKDVAERLASSSQKLVNGYLIPSSKTLWKFQTQDWQTGEFFAPEQWSTFAEFFSPEQFVLVPYRSRDNLSGFLSSVD
jgi:uncharacterized lipoprotein YddW (UPF0748 family)